MMLFLDYIQHCPNSTGMFTALQTAGPSSPQAVRNFGGVHCADERLLRIYVCADDRY